jgi:hypothetical protein
VVSSADTNRKESAGYIGAGCASSPEQSREALRQLVDTISKAFNATRRLSQARCFHRLCNLTPKDLAVENFLSARVRLKIDRATATVMR